MSALRNRSACDFARVHVRGQSKLRFHTSVKLLASDGEPSRTESSTKPQDKSETKPKQKKTMKELDEELQAAMEGRAGDGGLSGAELEGGKAVGMKRAVKDNMFRYI